MCPDDATEVPVGFGDVDAATSKYLMFSSNSKKWTDAALECQNQGASLTMFQNQADYDKLNQVMRKWLIQDKKKVFIRICVQVFTNFTDT